MKTTAAVLTEMNKPLQIEELTILPLKKGQVLVEVAYSGICHSQLNEIHGLRGEDKFLPHTLGHEGSGIVVEIGPDVAKVNPGDHVVLTWIKGSGHDVPSTKYLREDGGIVNSGAISTFMTHAVISENRLVPITKEMPLKESAILGCAIPTGAGTVLNTAHVQPGESVAVFGCGGIGLSVILASKMVGAVMIIAIDIRERKLTQAKKIAATHTIDASRHTVDGRLKYEDMDVGYGYNFGVLLELSKQTCFGLTYRSEVKLDFKDKPELNRQGWLLDSILNLGNQSKRTLGIDTYIPQAVMFSAWHQLTPTLAVCGKLGWQDWSRFGMPEISINGSKSNSFTADLKYRDTYHVAIGAQYRFAPQWLVSAGTSYDSSPIKHSYNRPPVLPLSARRGSPPS